MTSTLRPVLVIGGGLAGSEAAWQLAQRGVPVTLQEMRPTAKTASHQTDGLSELVFSYSFLSYDPFFNSVCLLHSVLRRSCSLILLMGFL